jgi:hypothetical protein
MEQDLRCDVRFPPLSKAVNTDGDSTSPLPPPVTVVPNKRVLEPAGLPQFSPGANPEAPIHSPPLPPALPASGDPAASLIPTVPTGPAKGNGFGFGDVPTVPLQRPAPRSSPPAPAHYGAAGASTIPQSHWPPTSAFVAPAMGGVLAEPTPYAPPPAATPEAEDDDLPHVDEMPGNSLRRGLLTGTGSFMGSMIVHLVAFILLSYFTFADLSRRFLPEPQPLIVDVTPATSITEEELQADQILRDIQSAASISVALTSSIPSVGDEGTGSGTPISNPALDATVFKDDEAGAQWSIPRPMDQLPSVARIASGVPDGALGDPYAVAANYQEALDRITEEILWMLAKRKVLVVWCFDQSESMKDDQQEIRDKVERVYSELGLRDEASGDALMTSVTSFGKGFRLHTMNPNGEVQPTRSLDRIRAAIDSVPVDPSGEEMMCQAVGRSIELHMQYAKQTDRQMALILVTDESGNRENNAQYLEGAVAMAKAAGCRVYILGREAVFGYLYAHMRWIHPQTGREHWLPIDRGPETGWAEQLQIDGFRRRTDAHPSGFGSYEQCRLARETNGIFFMLPSLETDLVKGQKGDYDPLAMRAYRPDLRSRQEIFMSRDQSILRSMLYKIVYDLNPDDENLKKVMEVRLDFAPRVDQFLNQAAVEQQKARIYLTYLDAATKKLEEIRYFREQEPTPRWQANYDLVYAQLLAYTARTYEYIAHLEHFIKTTKQPPTVRAGYNFVGWRVRESSQIVGPLTPAYVNRSTAIFQTIIDEHPGTPYSARAQWELSRGFGVDFVEHHVPIPPPRTNRPAPRPSAPAPQIPIPKL